ncbi:MAG TPA: F0F1 ATP synthase subunit epsilon [Xanthobacteraceae bacterium]|nr:F0F1 ATP synthase subunit epsilon [Xanthobacteraceae bacterium]
MFSGDVEHVVVPGSEGEFGVLAGHAPLIAMLKPGILSIVGSGQPKRIVVGGGFAEINPDGLTVLAELATPVEDFDTARLTSEIKDTEEDVADAKDDATRDKLRRKLDQLKALQDALAR